MSERRRMPTERKSVTAKVRFGGFRFYLTAGMYDDGTVGEIFVKDIGKEGSTIQGLLDGYATAISIALQYGTPVDVLARKFAARSFEPNGPTDDPDIPSCTSLLDYIARWLGHHFGDEQLKAELVKIAEETRLA